MGFGALILEWLHPLACALQIDFTHAPLACPDSAATQFIPMRPVSSSPVGLRCLDYLASVIESR